MGAVGVRPANERDDQQALPSKAEGHGGKQRSEGTIRVNIREPGFWESRLPQLQHRDQHREAEQTSDKCYIDTEPLHLFDTRFNLASGAGSTTDDKIEMNERRHVSQSMGQNSPRLTISLYSGKKCFPIVQASIGCKNCHKELLLNIQKKTKKETHIK